MRYLTSDWHLNHKNIIRYSSRPFDNLEQMKYTMLNNINYTVSKNDELFILGDLTFGNKDGLLDFIKSINCQVYIMAGNHDANNICNFLRRNGIQVLPNGRFSFSDGGYEFELSHIPVDSDKFNIHGHVHTVGFQTITSPNHYDCGVDNNNFKPISLGDIKQIINTY